MFPNPNWEYNSPQTVVKATCPDCGDIRTTARNVTLRLPEENYTGQGEYRFLCPDCNKIVLKPASESIVQILTAAGVKTEYFTPSLEILERPREDIAPAITLDDIIDLHQAMQDEEEWMRRLSEGL